MLKAKMKMKLKIGGVEREIGFTDDPSEGSCLEVEKMYFRHSVAQFVTKDMMMSKGKEDVDLDRIFSRFIADKRAVSDFLVFKDKLCKYATIILATGMSEDELKEIPRRRIDELYQRSREALGGDAEDFFEELGINTPRELRTARTTATATATATARKPGTRKRHGE